MTTTANTNRQSELAQSNADHMKAAAQKAYASQLDRTIDNEQITEYLPMVAKIVQRVVTYLKPPLSYEDLVSAGTVGLVKAARDYDPSHEAEFKTYAYIRIRGAILDELRSWSFVPANVDRQIRQALQLSIEIEGLTGSPPADAELAEKLDISIEKLYGIFENARAKQFVSIDTSVDDATPLADLLASANTAAPDERLEKNELLDRLTLAIQQLDQRQRQIVLLYYQQQLTMKQIADIFNITEPRVSQLHAKALFNLSIRLRQLGDGR